MSCNGDRYAFVSKLFLSSPLSPHPSHTGSAAKLHVAVLVAEVLLLLLTLSALTLTACSDPGVMFRQDAANRQAMYEGAALPDHRVDEDTARLTTHCRT